MADAKAEDVAVVPADLPPLASLRRLDQASTREIGVTQNAP